MQGSCKGLETGFERSFSQGRNAGFAVTMPTIRRAAIILEYTMSAMVLIDRGSGFNIEAAKLAIKVPLRVSRVGVKPLARWIEYLAHVVGFSDW